MQKRIECSISGRVQMVMYRDFATRTARHMDVVGEVENQTDGTVRVVAEGTKESLERYVRALKRGSLFSNVEDVRVDWKEPTGTFTTFTLRY